MIDAPAEAVNLYFKFEPAAEALAMSQLDPADLGHFTSQWPTFTGGTDGTQGTGPQGGGGGP